MKLDNWDLMTKAEKHEALENMTAEFLAKGGTIKVLLDLPKNKGILKTSNLKRRLTVNEHSQS